MVQAFHSTKTLERGADASLLALRRVEELRRQLHESQTECAALQKQHLILKDLLEKERINTRRLEEENILLKKATVDTTKADEEKQIQLLQDRLQASETMQHQAQELAAQLHILLNRS